MKVKVGAGGLRLDGFENVDVRTLGADVRHGHAAALPYPDGTVTVLLAHLSSSTST